MTARIRRLPGTDCRHNVRGRCLYEERLNPGYHRDWRCRVVQGWEESYDDFLLRAEAFRLEAAAAAGLWESHVERMVRRGPQCRDFVPGGDGVPGCSRALEELCLLRLPECSGRCRHFESRGEGPGGCPGGCCPGK